MSRPGKANPIIERLDKPSANGSTQSCRNDEPSAASRPATPAEPPAVRLVTRRASDIRPRAVRWLWPGRIPLGMVSELNGDPGKGKSTVTVDVAARVSRGLPFPGAGAEPRPPADVVMVNAEDDPDAVIAPRLIAAGADLARVHLVDHVLVGDQEVGLILPDGLDLLRAAIIEHAAVLVVLDPFNAFISGRVDANTDKDVRAALMAPLKRLAADTGAAVLLVRHLNKGTGSAMYRGNGSIGFTAAVRVSHTVGPHPDDKALFALAPVKSNLGPMPRTLAYRTDAVEVDVADGEASVRRPFGVVWWGAECDATADEVLAPPAPQQRAGDRGAAADFLRELLAGGPMAAAECYTRAEARGLSKRTVDRAKAELRIVPTKAGFSGGWTWALPADGGPRARTPPGWQPSGKPQGFAEGCLNLDAEGCQPEDDGADPDPDARGDSWEGDLP